MATSRYCAWRYFIRVCAFAAMCLSVAGSAHARDVLVSWNDGKARQSIIDFVEKVSKQETPGFVEPVARIAVFDNDGTLWSEQPAYFQLLFAIDRIKALADKHPEWSDRQPFKGVLEGDMKAVMKTGKRGLAELLMASHTGMSTDEFAAIVSDWIATARHPKTGIAYNEMIYQPMLELLRYLRDEDFQTWIVSGGGVHFVRAFAEKAYNIPPQLLPPRARR